MLKAGLRASLHFIQKFLQLEAAAGIILLSTLILAIIIANSSFATLYQSLLTFPVAIGISNWILEKPLLLWINDGLMTVFFMLLAMEVKREILVGQLANISQVILPCAAAVGGIIAPALIFLAFNYHDAEAVVGWAIPTATDVALALGMISLLGKRVPVGLKIFLAVLAIFDDIVAIVLIAIFYTHDLALWSLLIATSGVAILVLLNYFNVARITVYLVVGFIVWLAVLKSGVHATLAGVALGFCIPLTVKNKPAKPLLILEKKLHPWVAYLILPLFAFANAGVPFNEMQWQQLWQPIPLGIGLGLFLGKQLGIFACSWLVIKCGYAQLPPQANWRQLYGVAVLAGIGFTMSLFISSLAYGGMSYEISSRVGILLGSFLSALLGMALLLKPR